MYNKIVNPITNRKVDINSKLGQNILNNYLYSLRGGSGSFMGSRTGDSPNTNAASRTNRYGEDSQARPFGSMPSSSGPKLSTGIRPAAATAAAFEREKRKMEKSLTSLSIDEKQDEAAKKPWPTSGAMKPWPTSEPKKDDAPKKNDDAPKKKDDVPKKKPRPRKASATSSRHSYLW